MAKKPNDKPTMTPITADDPEAKSADVVAANLERLKALFPEAVSEDGVNVDVLNQLIGRTVTDAEEKYGLNWHGKRKARQLALAPSAGTLRPCPEESVDWDATQNLFIEGDNLEVLKLLQKSYANKVKMIYIDPPYNTGNDFVYADDFKDNVANYLKLTHQSDDSGSPLTSNADSSGRFHTRWLNMLYPRLKVARTLLRPDGVMFISIDDCEAANLRKVCDEVFGEENFVAQFTWETKRAARGVPPKNLLMHTHEYVLCYARVADNVKFRGLDRDESDFGNPDNDPRGLWRSESMKATGSQDNYFTISDPETGNEFHANWAFSESTVEQMIADGLVLFPDSSDGVPRQKKFIDSYTNETKAAITALGWHSTENATKQLMATFEGKKVFDFPKPLSLLKFIVEQSLSDGDTVLDFFAGSAGIAEAVFELNSADGASRRFILVQLPEPCDPKSTAFKEGYKTIAELGEERIRRAGKRISKENPLFEGDVGFRAFTLDTSNIRAWNPDPDDLEGALHDNTEHLAEGRSEADVLYELLLKLGLDLAVPIETRQVEGKDVHAVGAGTLFACLAETISRDDVEVLAQAIIDWHKELAPEGETTIVFRDSGFADDVAKSNLAAILVQAGFDDTRIRSL